MEILLNLLHSDWLNRKTGDFGSIHLTPEIRWARLTLFDVNEKRPGVEKTLNMGLRYTNNLLNI